MSLRLMPLILTFSLSLPIESGFGLARADDPNADRASSWVSSDEILPLWRRWELLFALQVNASHIKISRTSQVPTGVAAWSEVDSRDPKMGARIGIRGNQPPQVVPQLIEHELAHVFFARAIGGELQMSNLGLTEGEAMLIHECFAQWVSRDFLRLLPEASRKFLTTREALEYLSQSTISHQKKFQLAVARVLADLEFEANSSRHRFESDQVLARSPLLHSFRRFLAARQPNPGPNSNQEREAMAVATESLLSQLRLKSQRVQTHPPAFLLMDANTGEVLESEGDADRPLPVGSTLKPMFVGAMPRVQKSKVTASRDAIFACPKPQVGKVWKWQEALAHSCNGFFVSQKASELDWATWNQFFITLQLEVPYVQTVASAIGMIPEIHMNLEQMARAYLGAQTLWPNVLSELSETPKAGTLSDYPESKWFVDRQIQMKSGTLRGPQSDPRVGWIVAVGKPKSWIAVIRQEGQSPGQILSRLKARLERWLPWPGNLVSVRLLSLLRPDQQKLRCQTQWLVDCPRDPRGAASGCKPLKQLGSRWVTSTELPLNKNVICLGGPFEVRIPHSGGPEVIRTYYGSLRRMLRSQQKTGDHQEFSNPFGEVESSHGLSESRIREVVSRRRRQAREGSDVVLTVSDIHYVSQVLASEFPNGRAETQRALAHVVLHNASMNRHPGGGICDSSHCQVFSAHSVSGGSVLDKIRRIALHVAQEFKFEKQSYPNRWWPFALGGQAPWVVTRPEADLQRWLGLSRPIERITWGSGDKSGRGASTATGVSFSRVQLAIEGAQGLVHEITCEKFRNALRLPSCPQSVERNGSRDFVFKGLGEGHGLGLDLTRAEDLAAQGFTSEEILRQFPPNE